MLKVMFWDKTFVFVKDEARPAVEAVMGTSKKIRLKHLDSPVDGDTIIGSSIYRLTQAKYREYQHKLPQQTTNLLTAPAQPEVTDEVLEQRRARIADMRAKFLAKRNMEPKEANRNGNVNL